MLFTKTFCWGKKANRHGLKPQQWLHELFYIQLSVWSFEYCVAETCLTFSCAVPWQMTAVHMCYLLFSENNHHYIITIKCLVLSNVCTSALFKHLCWQQLRVAIGSSQKWKHMPSLHRNITRLCVCVASCYSAVFCFTLSKHPLLNTCLGCFFVPFFF